jgi:parallel beta-helix repeat protein
MKMARLRTWKGLSILVALALVLALGIVAVPMAGTVEATDGSNDVWVDDNGPSCPAGTGSGTQADPYCMIQTGIDNVAPGGTVHVYPGKYNENIVIEKSLILQSVSGDWRDTIIDDIINEAEINISGHVDVTVQGFQITAGAYGIYIGKVFSTVNILDCFIHDNNSDGIRVAGGGDVLNIERNIISQNGGSGIYIQQAWSTTNIRGNIIGAWWDGEGAGTIYYGNWNDGIDIDAIPVGIDVSIEGNHIVGNGTIVTGDHGINLDFVAGSVDIQDNVIGAWVYVYPEGRAVRFGGNKNHGIHVGEVSDTSSVNIEDNAISENGEDGINFGQGVSPIFGEVTILGNLIGGWTCYPGDYGYSWDPQRYYGNGDRGIEINQVGESGASGTVTIEGNKISENHRGAIDETGIYILNIYGVVTIDGNDIGSWTDRYGASYLGNNGAGIYIVNVYSGAELTIGPDNSIKKNIGDGIDVQWGEASSNIEIHHNQIDANGGKDEAEPKGLERVIIEGYGIELGSGGVCGAMVRDNIITDHREGVHIDQSSRENIIQNNEIGNNDHGVWVEGHDNQILRNDILNNKMMDSGIHLTSTAVGNIIHCNNIEGNLPYGVYNDNVDETVDAISNWWGDASGPSGVGPGSGDAVSENVNYSSWLSSEFQYCRECQGLPAPAVPTVNHWGIVAMITLFAGLLVWTVRRRRPAS